MKNLLIITVAALGIVAVLSFVMPTNNEVTGVIKSRNAELAAEAARALGGN